MVQTPTLVKPDIDINQEPLPVIRQDTITCCRILDLVELLRKAAEIVDRSWIGASDKGGRGGYGQDRLRTWNRTADPGPGLGVRILLDGIQRIPMIPLGVALHAVCHLTFLIADSFPDYNSHSEDPSAAVDYRLFCHPACPALLRAQIAMTPESS